ncbi:MAG: hypothetical protein PSV36_19210 [Algoriphagus sp.]|nr:hypothetical protein [Algoriphagus sp.]
MYSFPPVGQSDFPQALDEALFDSWLETGRASKISFAYLLIVWDEIDGKYLPVFAENRSEVKGFEKYGNSPVRQLLVAAYDLHSESRIV